MVGRTGDTGTLGQRGLSREAGAGPPVLTSTPGGRSGGQEPSAHSDRVAPTSPFERPLWAGQRGRGCKWPLLTLAWVGEWTLSAPFLPQANCPTHQVDQGLGRRPNP